MMQHSHNFCWPTIVVLEVWRLQAQADVWSPAEEFLEFEIQPSHVTKKFENFVFHTFKKVLF
jgi:hypothetical protein